MSVADIEPGLEANLSARARAAAEPSVHDFIVLLKPRVMSLVVFTALVGMAAAAATAADPTHPVLALAGLLCVAVGAGASGALNMWWDADIDAEMRRTAKRPVPAGRLSAEDAFAFGLGLSLLSVLLLALIGGLLAAALLAGTIAFYVVVYTMWLKRRTPQNIVIGGLAGATPPLIGWTLITGEIALEPLILVAVIFLWTPPHSWALALFRREDYGRVGVPMLPVAAGDALTRRRIWHYTLALTPVAIAPALTPIAGPLYGAVAVIASARMLQLAWRLRDREVDAAVADKWRAEKKFFGFSILYLFVLFLALLLEAAARGAGLLPNLLS